jgi:hypothetical protein
MVGSCEGLGDVSDDLGQFFDCCDDFLLGSCDFDFVLVDFDAE